MKTLKHNKRVKVERYIFLFYLYVMLLIRSFDPSKVVRHKLLFW